MARTRIVILGGGSGGLELASALAGGDRCEVTLVDRLGAHLWKPRLHEFAAGTVSSTLTEISFYILGAMRGFRFEQGSVEAIDPAARTVRLAPMASPAGQPVTDARELAYDLCVVALGGVTPDFGTTGVVEHATRLDAKEDAERFREHFVCLMLHARETRRTASVVIVGSGATGTELAAHLRVAERAFRDRFDRKTDRELLSLTILEAAPELMPGASGDLRTAVGDRLQDLEISYHTGAKVSEVTGEAVTTEAGSRWPADVTVWAAGLVGHPVLSRLCDFEMDRSGRIRVDDRLRSTRSDDIYVLGDAASLVPEDADSPLPPTAQCASQQADYLSDALPQTIRGGTPRPFRFKDKGRLISLGMAGSVGQLGLGTRDDMFVKGKFATATYNALQRRHQWSVLGPVRGTVAIMADMMLPTRGPALKLHG